MYVETTSGAQFSALQAITTTADSTNIFDVTGAGSGNAPAMIGTGGLNTAMGIDLGAGDGMAVPQIIFEVVTPTTVTGTLTITLSAAPDNGSYSPGSYTTLYSSAALTGTTQLKAATIYKFNIPPIIPGQALPRFYKLTYTVTGSISLTANAYVLLNASDLRIPTLYGNNFIAL